MAGLPFYWMVGEESSDPVVAFEGRRVRVDQMESTGHLARVEADLADIAGVGASHVRYGVNWRRVQPDGPRAFAWDLWDRALAGCDAAGLVPVVDLLHFGTPDWLDGVADPRLPDAFLRYTEAFLRRYPEPAWFTPVNEPFITAHFSTGIGIWNESVVDEAIFVRTLAQLCLADLRASALIRADRPATFLHSEALGFDLDAPRANAFRLLPFDFRYGHPPDEVIHDAVDRLDDAVRAGLEALAFTDGVIAGHDYYPVSVPADGRSYASLARDFHRRYQLPFMVAETSNLGLEPDEGPAWLTRIYEEGCALRAEGLPFVGICWYSRGDQHDWHTTLTRPVREVTPVGLFDIDRRPRPAAAAFRRLATQG
ncbi:MAG TPA: family 1 glycosylhydrolase [Acidimicrobiales bacterium]|nr:family 1 glycosylhydrolase [Acidimicrobiales bacterium]